MSTDTSIAARTLAALEDEGYRVSSIEVLEDFPDDQDGDADERSGSVLVQAVLTARGLPDLQVQADICYVVPFDAKTADDIKLSDYDLKTNDGELVIDPDNEFEDEDLDDIRSDVAAALSGSVALEEAVREEARDHLADLVGEKEDAQFAVVQDLVRRLGETVAPGASKNRQQAEAAEALAVPKSTMKKWLLGQSRPNNIERVWRDALTEVLKRTPLTDDEGTHVLAHDQSMNLNGAKVHVFKSWRKGDGANFLSGQFFVPPFASFSDVERMFHSTGEGR